MSARLSTYRNLNLGVTGQVIKSAAGAVLEYYIYNNAGATRYVKFYNKATAPTSSDTPIRTYGIPAGAAANLVMDGVNGGIGFLTGISVRATTGVADNDTGAPTANDVVINIGYL